MSERLRIQTARSRSFGFLNAAGIRFNVTRQGFQFDKHFLVQTLAQYDSSQERVLTDFLASYEFVPDTVFHAGYGSLYEKGFGADERSRYLTINRGLFLKASYLRRF